MRAIWSGLVFGTWKSEPSSGGAIFRPVDLAIAHLDVGLEMLDLLLVRDFFWLRRGSFRLRNLVSRSLVPWKKDAEARGRRCDARRLSTGRSIRAWHTLCGRQMARNAGRALASEALVPWLGGPRSQCRRKGY
jgi:hypothetical protein